MKGETQMATQEFRVNFVIDDNKLSIKSVERQDSDGSYVAIKGPTKTLPAKIDGTINAIDHVTVLMGDVDPCVFINGYMYCW